MIISPIMTPLTRMLSAYPTIDGYKCPSLPRISNPALQKADIEWKTAIHIPFQPKSWQKTGNSRSAPIPSIRNVPFRMNFVKRTMPPTLGAEIAFCMVLRCISEIFLPDIMDTAAATVTTPNPPVCIRRRMTACPKEDQ